MRGLGRWFALIALLVAVAVVGNAYTASNTVAPTSAGEGSGSVTATSFFAP